MREDEVAALLGDRAVCFGMCADECWCRMAIVQAVWPALSLNADTRGIGKPFLPRQRMANGCEQSVCAVCLATCADTVMAMTESMVAFLPPWPSLQDGVIQGLHRHTGRRCYKQKMLTP